MSDYVYYDILSAVQTQLQAGNIDLTGEGSQEDILDAAIVIRHQPIQVKPEDWGQDETTPGIIVSPGFRTRTNIAPYLGNNCEDDVRYPFVIQIIDDTETGRYDSERLQTWMKWQQKIRQYFTNQNIRKAVYTSDGYVDVTLEAIEDFNEKMFVIHRKTVFLMAFEAVSREPRTAAGSV